MSFSSTGRRLLFAVGFALAVCVTRRALAQQTPAANTPAPTSTPALIPLPLPPLATNDPPAAAPEAMPDSPDRVAAARARRGAHLAEMFAAAGVPYPARAVYLRAFKWEGQLELWARAAGGDNAPFRLVHTYPILRASGRLGPKRREGDGQVPEGFYRVERFNPRSLFHLSLGLDDPNASDLLRTTDPAHPGSDVFIHGNALSAGCLAMGDAAAEEIYLATRDAQATAGTVIAVDIFPVRMDEDTWNQTLASLCAGRPELEAFWRSLRAGYEAFEHARRLPVVRVGPRGEYLVE